MELQKNLTYHHGAVEADDRRSLIGQSGMVLWLTGLSGSGKSTIGAALEKELVSHGYSAYLLDGDNLRHGICADLGFSDADRSENIRRIAETAALMCDAGLIVIVSAISPTAAMRKNARRIIEPRGAFIEVYVKADVATCSLRDPKGLYKAAFDGKLPGFTGVSAPYDEPLSPDAELDTRVSPLTECVSALFRAVQDAQTELSQVVCSSVTAAIKAGTAIMAIYERGFTVEYKADASPLTEADKAADTLIREVLSADFPHIPILSEETADNLSRLSERYLFVVDPLDGTKEFVKRNGEFTVNIALIRDRRPIAGVVFVPATGKLYYSAYGLGAYACMVADHAELFNEKDLIHVSDRTDSLRAVGSRSHSGERDKALFAHFGAKMSAVVSIGSSIKGCLVAEGAADIYYRFGPTCEWDTAAMHAIVLAAGGTVKEMDGGELVYNRENTLNSKGFYMINRIENEVAGI